MEKKGKKRINNFWFVKKVLTFAIPFGDEMREVH